MAGGLYIFYVGGCFLIVLLVIAATVLMLWLGHLRHKQRTGSTAGFLEREPDPPGPPAESDKP